MSALRILLLSDTYPWPLNNGAIQRIYHLLAPLDFVFVDGAHDLAHVVSDSLKAYEALRPFTQ